MTKKYNLFHPKLTLVEFSIELVQSQKMQGSLQMFFMFFSKLGIDEDVINKNNDKFIQVRFVVLLIRSIKAAGALVRPKGITKNS